MLAGCVFSKRITGEYVGRSKIFLSISVFWELLAFAHHVRCGLDLVTVAGRLKVAANI